MLQPIYHTNIYITVCYKVGYQIEKSFKNIISFSSYASIETPAGRKLQPSFLSFKLCKVDAEASLCLRCLRQLTLSGRGKQGALLWRLHRASCSSFGGLRMFCSDTHHHAKLASRGVLGCVMTNIQRVDWRPASQLLHLRGVISRMMAFAAGDNGLMTF